MASAYRTRRVLVAAFENNNERNAASGYVGADVPLLPKSIARNDFVHQFITPSVSTRSAGIVLGNGVIVSQLQLNACFFRSFPKQPEAASASTHYPFANHPHLSNPTALQLAGEGFVMEATGCSALAQTIAEKTLGSDAARRKKTPPGQQRLHDGCGREADSRRLSPLSESGTRTISRRDASLRAKCRQQPSLLNFHLIVITRRSRMRFGLGTLFLFHRTEKRAPLKGAERFLGSCDFFA